MYSIIDLTLMGIAFICTAAHQGQRYLKALGKVLVVLIVTSQVTACSKTVKWEEEVRLNTGQSIWIRREVVYSLQGGAGNPLDYKYRPTRVQTIAFSWNGRDYRYEGDDGFKVLAITAAGEPVLVKNADAGAWDATANYKCTTPFYVQFEPDQSGKRWTWPPKIDAWLFNQPTNLLVEIGDPSKFGAKVTHEQKLSQPFLADPHLKFMQQIDPDYTGDLCKRRTR